MALLGKLGRALFSECHWEMSEQLTQQSQGSQGRRVVPVERAEYGKSLRCETKAHVGAIQSSMSVIDNAERKAKVSHEDPGISAALWTVAF